jgi:hypothetical protein
MCANCVAQASVYVGASVGALRVMGARARARRGAGRTRTARPAPTHAPVTGHGADDPTGPVGGGAPVEAGSSGQPPGRGWP